MSLIEKQSEHCSTDSSMSLDEKSRGIPISSADTRKPRLLREDMQDHIAASSMSSSRDGRISRTLVNFWLDTLLAVVFVVLSVSAVVVQFVFPPGIAAGGWTLWGMSYGQWCSIQFSLIATLGLGVLVHVMLHWTWVCSVLVKRVLHQGQLPDNGTRTIYGVGLLICLLVISAVTIRIAQWMIVRPS